MFHICRQKKLRKALNVNTIDKRKSLYWSQVALQARAYTSFYSMG